MTQLPSGDFAVDSFFDITYEIEFEGCPDSQLADLSGVTLDTRYIESFCEPEEGECCVAPDNGTGTVDFPVADCPYDNPDDAMRIIDGLPPGTTIELVGPLSGIQVTGVTPGGIYGGEIIDFIAQYEWDVAGTGDLDGFARTIDFPLTGQMHIGPRNPGDPVQTFPMELTQLYGQLFGDPDFCTLNCFGGLDFDLPSPGQTTLSQLPSGDFAVDSFFDITYAIEFEGCPGSILEGYMGMTFGTINMDTCQVPPLLSDCCVEPDNGLGTVDFPAENCDYASQDEVIEIIDGLPPGTTIEFDGPLTDIAIDFIVPGGGLGGELSSFTAELQWDVKGTGDLEGFNRTIYMPVDCEVHTGPRTPGDPEQAFPTDMFELSGQIFGDPDFCELIINGGTNFGLPSPGETTLTQLPSGDFAVDSFFDITYQIDFVGCPGSILEGLSGSTIGVIRMSTCLGLEPPRPLMVTASVVPFEPVDRILLEWNYVPGATYYKIFSSNQAYGAFPSDWYVEATTADNFWIDEAAVPKKFYIVTAGY